MRRTYPVSLSCEVLQVSASGYFGWLQQRGTASGEPPRRHSDEALLAHIRAIHAEVKGEYGWPRMHKELLARGIRVGKERVRRLMQQHGIKARTGGIAFGDLLQRTVLEQGADGAVHPARAGAELAGLGLQPVEFGEHLHRDRHGVFVELEEGLGIVNQYVGVQDVSLFHVDDSRPNAGRMQT